MRNRLALALFPLAQILLFVAAALVAVNSDSYKDWALALLLAVIASLAMSFSLHITYHYHVHHKPTSKILERLLDLIYTILLGMPFQSYQLQHFMHHKYDNEIGDITSTYEQVDGQIQAKTWSRYSFLWFIQLTETKDFRSRSIAEGFLSEKISKKLRRELLLNAVVFVLLLLWSWKVFLLYYTMFYIGWSLIALHNYGQHLPVMTSHKIGFSYYPRWYNFLFVNNGLHAEHHDKPQVRYEELTEKKELAGLNNLPHVLQPLCLSENQRLS